VNTVQRQANKVLKMGGLENVFDFTTCQQARTKVRDAQVREDMYEELCREVEEARHSGVGGTIFVSRGPRI